MAVAVCYLTSTYTVRVVTALSVSVRLKFGPGRTATTEA